jgi:hypothetical protein
MKEEVEKSRFGLSAGKRAGGGEIRLTVNNSSEINRTPQLSMILRVIRSLRESAS